MSYPTYSPDFILLAFCFILTIKKFRKIHFFTTNKVLEQCTNRMNSDLKPIPNRFLFYLIDLTANILLHVNGRNPWVHVSSWRAKQVE